MAKFTAGFYGSLLAGMIASLLGVSDAVSADGGEGRTILILASDDSLLPFTRTVTDGITQHLRAAYPQNLTIFTEFMDASRSTRDSVTTEASRLLEAKYADRRIDLIFSLGPRALELLAGERNKLLADVPVVFAGIRRGNPLIEELPAGMGGVTSEYNASKTVELAAALQPDLQQIILISGASELDRVWHDRALSELQKYQDRFLITDLAGLPLDDLLGAVKQAGPRSAIICLAIFRDGHGSTFSPSELISRIAALAGAPTYSMYPYALGRGVVGGYISPYEDMAAGAVDLALPILSGESTMQPFPVIDLEARYQVDWRALQRWRMNASLLPPSTAILFRTPSLWAEHWPTALLALTAIVAQTFIIAGFWIQKQRRRNAELSLRRVNEHIEIAAGAARLGLWSWHPFDGRVWTTPQCRLMLGAEAGEDIDLSRFLFLLAGNKADGASRALLEAVQTNGKFEAEFRRADAAGGKLWLSVTGHSIRRSEDMLIAGTLVDITERKVAQLDAEQQRRQVIHLTRVAVLGELSGALAHELNQPLTAILSNAQTAQRLVARSSPDLIELQEILADIVEDDHRAASVLSKLRTLIRKEDAQYAALDINQIVDDVLHLVHSDLIERQVHVHTELGGKLPPARGDRVQIQQVLINLVRNACDAMSADPAHSHRLVLTTELNGEGGLAVRVSDNGGGIVENLRDRLFEPFVTTKAQGLGLGLAISRSILSAHGGKIWCENPAGGGAIFGFSLPAFDRSIAWTN